MPLFIIIIFIVLVVWFRKQNHFDEGTITGKKYEPEEHREDCKDVHNPNDYWTTTITTFCYRIIDREDYIIVVKGKQRSGIVFKTVYVSKEYYDRCKVGDIWYKTSESNFVDNNNSKTLISSRVR